MRQTMHTHTTPVFQLDANVLIRFLRNDHKDHSPRAARLIQDANDGKIILEVSAVTISEIYYVLKSVYQVDRRHVAQTLSAVLNTPAFQLMEHARILDALSRVEKVNVDFGDAYLAASAEERKTMMASFDRDLDKFEDVQRHEP